MTSFLVIFEILFVLKHKIFSDDMRTDLICAYPLTGNVDVAKATESGVYEQSTTLQTNFCQVAYFTLIRCPLIQGVQVASYLITMGI